MNPKAPHNAMKRFALSSSAWELRFQITCETRITMCGNRVAPNHQILNVVEIEQTQEFSEVGGGV
jgi:hypothetical protein